MKDAKDIRRAEQLHALGIAIGEQRELKNITQADLATMLGFTGHAHLSRIENGKQAPSLKVLLEIADILEISVTDLLRDL